jgi:hypothetical protein
MSSLLEKKNRKRKIRKRKIDGKAIFHENGQGKVNKGMRIGVRIS